MTVKNLESKKSYFAWPSNTPPGHEWQGWTKRRQFRLFSPYFVQFCQIFWFSSVLLCCSKSNMRIQKFLLQVLLNSFECLGSQIWTEQWRKTHPKTAQCRSKPVSSGIKHCRNVFVLTASCVYSFDDWHLTLLPYINFRSPFDLCQCDTDV